jgi:Na+/H+ antiporter NhaA
MCPLDSVYLGLGALPHAVVWAACRGGITVRMQSGLTMSLRIAELACIQQHSAIKINSVR